MSIFTKLSTYRPQERKSPNTEFQTADNTATFLKDSMTQTIEVPIYDNNYKEMGGVVNNVDFRYREVA